MKRVKSKDEIREDKINAILEKIKAGKVKIRDIRWLQDNRRANEEAQGYIKEIKETLMDCHNFFLEQKINSKPAWNLTTGLEMVRNELDKVYVEAKEKADEIKK